MLALVTFDFWQTLLAETPEGLRRAHALRLAGVREALARAGHAYDGHAMAEADARALAAFEAIWREHRSMAAPEQIGMFLGALDPALPGALSAAELAAVTTAYEEPVLSHPPTVSPGAAEALRWCRARGLAVALISNTGRTPGTVLRRVLEGAGLLDAFLVLTFSDEAGVRKPATEIFRQTLARAGAGAEAAVHVGDDPVTDVAGARAVGMRALHYVPAGRSAAAPSDGVLRHFGELPAVLARFL